ncbi:MAG: hypothetical protein AAFP85_05680 [Pseudomonadota bacterium]
MKKLFGLVLVGGLYPCAAITQEAEPGGVFFTLDIGQTLEASTDRDLSTPEDEDGVEGLTSFRFGAVTETRTQRLSFGLGGGARAFDGELTNDDISLGLAYSRNSADSLLETSLSAVQANIEFLRDASDFINDDGVLVLPDDFEDLVGTGTRTATTFAASLRWGETNPIGYRIALSQQLLRYQDASAALLDTDTGTISAGARLNINEVTTGNLDLSYTQTDEVGEAADDRLTLGSSITFARPLGNLTYRLSTSRNEDDDVFWAGSISRRLELPRSALSGSIGVVEDDDGDVRPVGDITFAYPRPTGQIELSAARTLAPGDDRGTTTLRAVYAQAVTPVSNLQFEINVGAASEPDGSDRLATGAVSGSYGIELGEFWQLDVGARHNIRDDDGSRSQSNTLFVALNRVISWRP